MNKNQKNKKILFTLLLTLTFVVGLIPLSIRGANADELTQPLEQMVISTTGEQLNEGDVSEPNESETSEKNDQEIVVENSEVPEKEALEPNATKEEEKPAEEAPPVVEEKPAEEAPPVVEEEPAEETPPVVEEEPAEETPPVAEEKPAEEFPPVVEEKTIEDGPPVEEKEPIELGSSLDSSIKSDGVMPSKVTSDRDSTETLKLPVVMPSKTTLPKNIGLSSIDSTTTPGEVTLSKVAVPVPKLVNTWDITLRIEGSDTEKSSDIVLVIDRSGSMKEPNNTGQRLKDAQFAAKEFIDALKDSPNTRIALVSFSSGSPQKPAATTHTGFLDINIPANRITLNKEIEDLEAEGGTNTQAGIKAADDLFNAVPAAQKADFNNLVLLSDGLPTQSYTINYGNLDPSNEMFIKVEDRVYHTAKNIKEDKYDYSISRMIPSGRFGGINSETTSAGRTGTRRLGYTYYYYNHSNSAISQAEIFKNRGTNRTLWTVALDTDVKGNNVLKEIATKDKAFKSTSDQLNTIFQQIAGSINAAAKDIVVTDPMGQGFEIADLSSITVSQKKSEDSHPTYSGNVLKWEVGDLFKPIEENPKIKYAEMTYRVSITKDILDLPIPKDGRYPTNGEARVTYKNEKESITKPFPKPTVNPIFLKVEKVLLNADGNVIEDGSRKFEINVLNATTGKSFKDFGLTPKGNYSLVTTTDLRLADTYKVSEILPDDDMFDYDVTITVKDNEEYGFVEKDTFNVEKPQGTPLIDSGQNDIHVIVTNKEKPRTTDVVVSKLVTGNMGNQKKDFEFTATLTNAKGAAINFPASPDSSYSVSGNTAKFDLIHGKKVTLRNLPIGSEIEIKESENEGYELTVNKGNVENPEDKEKISVVKNSTIKVPVSVGKYEFTFTNHKPDVPIDTGVSLDSLPYIIILILIATGGIGRILWKRKQTELD